MNETYQKIISGYFSPETDVQSSNKDHEFCYRALYYASKYDRKKANEELFKQNEKHPDHRCSFLYETQCLIHFSSRDFNLSKDYASKALSEESTSYFAKWVLARIAIFEKKYNDSAELYKSLLINYPSDHELNLNLSLIHI